MAAINKHGRRISHLKAVSGSTADCIPYGKLYVQISYDTRSGELIAREHLRGSYTDYRDEPAIVHIANAYKHMSMQELADRVHEVLSAREVLA